MIVCLIRLLSISHVWSLNLSVFLMTCIGLLRQGNHKWEVQLNRAQHRWHDSLNQQKRWLSCTWLHLLVFQDTLQPFLSLKEAHIPSVELIGFDLSLCHTIPVICDYLSRRTCIHTHTDTPAVGLEVLRPCRGNIVGIWPYERCKSWVLKAF